MPSVRIKRGTRAQIASAAAANGLKQGELYHVTDENRVDVGTGTGATSALATKSEVDGKEPTINAGTTDQYFRGDKTWSDFFTDVRATVLTGLSTATDAVITAADTALQAIGKLQAQITGHKDAASNAHPASTISNTPSGGIAATTVQGAINELAEIKVDLAAATGASLVGFQQEDTGAVSTTVQSKLRELVSVGDYGDIDGIGTITTSVPSQFATIQAAFNWLSSRTIAAGTTVVIQVADGTHDYTGTAVSLNHPQGSQIRLVGNETTPTNCVLTWTNTSSGIDGLSVNNGNTLGYINGFHITRTAHAGTANTTGLLADNGATIICGPNMRVSNHYYGIAARHGSYIKADSAVVDGAGDVGIWAFVGSTISCESAAVSNTADPLQPLGFGIQAEYGSSINCHSASASGNKIAGIASLSNSNVRALSATASNNTGSGFYARDNSNIENHNATANNNTRYGEEVIAGGAIIGDSVTLSGNTLGSVSGFVYLDNSAPLGARIAANGPLRIDNNGTNSTFFNTSGGPQFSVSHADSSVNYFVAFGGSTGVGAHLKASGSDANVAAVVASQNSAVVVLQSNGRSAFLANNVSASAVNYGQVDGSTTGNSVDFKARGSDTNVDLGLSPKGSGVVKFGTWTSNADVAVNGYITIKDAAGNTRKLATIA